MQDGSEASRGTPYLWPCLASWVVTFLLLLAILAHGSTRKVPGRKVEEVDMFLLKNQLDVAVHCKIVAPRDVPDAKDPKATHRIVLRTEETLATLPFRVIERKPASAAPDLELLESITLEPGGSLVGTLAVGSLESSCYLMEKPEENRWAILNSFEMGAGRVPHALYPNPNLDQGPLGAITEIVGGYELPGLTIERGRVFNSPSIAADRIGPVLEKKAAESDPAPGEQNPLEYAFLALMISGTAATYFSVRCILAYTARS